MVNNKYFKLFFYIIIFVAFLISLTVTMRRFQFEAVDNGVEVVMSYKELKRLSIYGGYDFETLLQQIRDKGHVTQLA